jgi:EpsI family protein
MPQTHRSEDIDAGDGRSAVLRAVVVCVLMVACALAAWWLQPKASSRQAPEFSLEALFPSAVPGWRLEPSPANFIINPQQQETLDRLYSQILARTYVDGSGYRVMLSVAYGNDQRGVLSAHFPDLCYPAQGFKVLSASRASVSLEQGALGLRRLQTEMGSRKEPLSYWFVYGHRRLASDAHLEKRLVDVKLGLQGRIADGLLVRVSSIDPNTEGAFARQEAFVKALVNSIAPDQRYRVIGLSES